jgi:hypothetical protein
MGAEGLGHRLSQAVQPGLARLVGGMLRLASEGDVHDPAPARGHHVVDDGVQEIRRGSVASGRHAAG